MIVNNTGDISAEEYQDWGDKDEASRHHAPASVETVQSPPGTEQEKEEREKEIKGLLSALPLLLNVGWRVLLVILINQTVAECLVESLWWPAFVIPALARPATLTLDTRVTDNVLHLGDQTSHCFLPLIPGSA